MNIRDFKQDLLNKLYEPYKNCVQCPLGSLGRTHVVFGEGDANAQLMFVGEGPGREEDKQGRPFIGRAGQLLTKTLLSLNIARNEVYITNVVKCRPPHNRNPEPIESTTCKNLLLFNQIKIIKPTIIITLGAIALHAFFQKPLKISQERGKIHRLNSLKLMPTFHPAYILRNPAALSFFIDDLKTAIENI